MPIGHSLLQVVSILSVCLFFLTGGFRDSKQHCSSPLSIGLTGTSVLYAHWVQTIWWQDPKTPEQFGFLSDHFNIFL